MQDNIILGREKTKNSQNQFPAVQTVLIIYYIHRAIYTVQAGSVDKRIVHFQHMEECTKGTDSLYCSGYSRGVGSLH